MKYDKQKNNYEFGFVDNDTPESLKLDLPPEEIDRLYEEAFGKKSDNKHNEKVGFFKCFNQP